jgi:hypothetical protein
MALEESVSQLLGRKSQDILGFASSIVKIVVKQLVLPSVLTEDGGQEGGVGFEC